MNQNQWAVRERELCRLIVMLVDKLGGEVEIGHSDLLNVENTLTMKQPVDRLAFILSTKPKLIDTENLEWS